MSRVLPDAVVYRVRDELRISDEDYLMKELPKMIEEGLQRLYDFQHVDGGVGWWKEDPSDPTMTAYILFGLNEVRKAGFAVDPEVIERGINFLREWLLRTKVDTPPSYAYSHIATGANVRAYVLYVLSELGRGEWGMSVNLYENRHKLDHYGRAYLALTLYILNGNKADVRVRNLLEDLSEAAIVSDGMAHWEDVHPEPWSMGSDVRTTAIVLDALVRIEPANPLIPKVVRWLVASRRNGHWGSTQATSMSLISLVDYLLMSGELYADYTYRILVNGEEVGGGIVDESNLTIPVRIVIPIKRLKPDEVNLVEVIKEKGEGQTGKGVLYWSLYLRHYLSGEKIEPKEEGIVVERKYTLLSDSRPIREVRVGDVVEVRLRIEPREGVNFLIVEDPLPAGLEAIDVSLEITSRAYGGERRDWHWTHVELRDEMAVAFGVYLEPGVYEFAYLARATTPGVFQTIPPRAYPMYASKPFGRGEGLIFKVSE